MDGGEHDRWRRAGWDRWMRAGRMEKSWMNGNGWDGWMRAGWMEKSWMDGAGWDGWEDDERRGMGPPRL